MSGDLTKKNARRKPGRGRKWLSRCDTIAWMGSRTTDNDGAPPAWLADELREAVQLYYPRVRRRYARLIWDANTADDLAQEVFARLCHAMWRDGPRKTPWRLVEGIMRNVLLEFFRRKAKSARPLDVDEDIPDTHLPTPAEMAEVGDTREVVWALVKMLGAEEQLLLVARHCWGMNGTELARFFGIPRTTLIGRYNHAMNTLREWLTERGVML